MSQGTPISLFALHSRSWQSNRYVYPVISRRSRGLSIGVNLNPDKACNFDCIYCSVDRTVPPAYRDVDLPVLRQELSDMIELAASGELFAQPPFDRTPAELRRINDVAFSGDGEPTSCRHFGECARIARMLLDARQLHEVKIVVITNATLFHQKPVRDALAFLDAHNGEIWAKLDAGTEAYYKQIDRTPVPFHRVLDNLLDAGRLRPIVIQSLFMRVHGEGPSNAEIDAYADRLRDLNADGCQIKLVQIYTTARDTAEAYVSPLPATRLNEIAAKVSALGLKVETYPGVE